MFLVCSTNCSKFALPDGQPCLACQDICLIVSQLAELAAYAPPHTNYRYFTHEQLQRLLHEHDEAINSLKLKGLNLGRKCASAMRRLDDFWCFLIVVATADVSRLRQLVHRAVKSRASVAEITRRIKEAAAGVYRAQGYEQGDYDITLPLLRCGCRSLLWSMGEHSSLPSVRALKQENIFMRLMPSVGMPQHEDISFNLEEVFERHLRRARPPKVARSGMSLLWDELAMEEVAVYLLHSDSVVGLCREHAGAVKTCLTTFEDAEAIAHVLAHGDVHYSSECSVIALALFSTLWCLPSGSVADV
ncbi:hypothetical protein BV20DRAFT_938014 [Pilatotrama ljubarskyi]|nr:hypothetical protein BV20DRAFT_938014 [Pilatotrama ljubarskyi]